MNESVSLALSGSAYSPVYDSTEPGDLVLIKDLIENTENDEIKKLLKHHLSNMELQDHITSQVLSIHQILPDMSLLKIRRYVEFCEGSQENALNMLLNAIPLQESIEFTDPRMVNLYQLEGAYIKSKTRLERFRQQSSQGKKPLDRCVDEDEEEVEEGGEDWLSKEKNQIKKIMRDEIKRQNTRFFCKGEEECLKRKKFRVYSLQKTNEFRIDAEHLQFRIVESQFFRMMSMMQGGYGGGGYVISKVDYIVNPKVMDKFWNCRKKLAEKHGWLEASMKPVILFHGTSVANIENIIKTNFLRSKIGSTTDKGWYGFGFYFSENPGLSLSYARGNQMLVCLGLVGKAFELKSIQTGRALEKGYDSHIGGGGSEVIIFEPDQVLPCYRIYFNRPGQGGQQY